MSISLNGDGIISGVSTLTNPSEITVGTGASVFSPATNELALGTNGVERVRVSAAGSFGLGAVSPSEKLHVGGGSGENTTIKVESTATATERSAIEFFNGSVSRGRIGGSNDFDGITIDSSSTESAAAIRFRTGGGSLSEKLRVLAAGGLTFNGDTAAANALDDYEEGTWTPNIDNAYVTSPGTTYNSRAGKYVKIGTMVLARFTMNIAGVTNSGVGPFFFGGLPFTHDTSDISHRGLQASLYISGPNTPAGTVNVNLGYATLDNGNYYLTLSTPIDDAASNNSRVIQASDISNGDVISGTIMYIST